MSRFSCLPLPIERSLLNFFISQYRSRAEKSENKLVSSLNYFNSIGCEDRILCELLLSASATQNAEQHIENLLNTFTEE